MREWQTLPGAEFLKLTLGHVAARTVINPRNATSSNHRWRRQRNRRSFAPYMSSYVFLYEFQDHVPELQFHAGRLRCFFR